MPKYQGKEITATDRAYEALIMKSADDKDVNARKFVESLKPKYSAVVVTTACLIYNATGNRLTYVGSHDWQGHTGVSPYPLVLENGQWGAFLHVHNIPSFTGSIGATIYHGQDENGDASDWMLAWYNPWDRALDHNRVCTEIRVADHYKGINWSSIYDYKLSKFYQYSNDMWNGCYSSVITGYSDVIDVNTANRICILRRLGNNDAVMVDEAEFLCHQQLQNLYNSTREAKV
ncbi:hypothetical protein FEM48_Zijuj11G0152900 [Ziziphus jujuba var. spinosa]|uniref:23 kDa jasmonate-induced protein-like n=1 Tax=Ziziphus jujuba var. spinosa TaxID=714518 RepID=A0A978UJP9_ZIZJJ|nr:hypothetical protein FEM48_Zijuj11G0152900 [Ziziphus jujuba var. spinosa]